MTELKTLKDLEHEAARKFDSIGFNIKCSCGEIRVPIILSAIDLKQEAIKHIKKLRDVIEGEGKMPKYNRPYAYIKDWRGQVLSQITWIKHFFNITEEDLK